jgi:hypothetical protein
MENESLDDCLQRHRELALANGVRFSVVSSGPGLDGPRRIHHHGTFDDPADALALARSVRDGDVTVMADGRGAYWSSGSPQQVDDDLFQFVLRHRQLGPERAERDERRQDLETEIERLQADMMLAEATAAVQGCRDRAAALENLRAGPLRLSLGQAEHLLTNRRLHLVTGQGRREAQAAVDRAVRALEAGTEA